MSTKSLKKAVIAAIVIAPLALNVTACGKDKSAPKPAATTTTAASTTESSSEESTTQSPTSSSEETSTDSSTDSSTSAAETSAEQPSADKQSSAASAPAAAAAKNTINKPPVKGNPASPAQVSEFKNVIKAVMPQKDRKAMMINVLKYTCSSLMQKQMGPQFNRTQMLTMLQQLPPDVMQKALQSVAQTNASIPTSAPDLVSVSNAVVNGSNGYARMVFKGKDGKTITTEQHFVREDGIWRVCE